MCDDHDFNLDESDDTPEKMRERIREHEQKTSAYFLQRLDEMDARCAEAVRDYYRKIKEIDRAQAVDAFILRFLIIVLGLVGVAAIVARIIWL